MGIRDIFGKKSVTAEVSRQPPYIMKTAFVPYKLKSSEKNNTDFIISLKNTANEPVLGSIVVEVPGHLSLDSIGLAKRKEIKLGTIAPNQEIESKVGIYGDVGTEKGEYTVTATAYVHYKDYTYVANSMTKRSTLQVL